MNYLVNAIYATIQGEGALTGTPMVLLRLHGCGVGCPFCDTKETWEVFPDLEIGQLSLLTPGARTWAKANAAALAQYIKAEFPVVPWVLVTGGEPADQPLAELVIALHGAGYKVALETSGTAIGHIDAPFDWVCVSPKVGMPGGRLVQRDAIAKANEIKWVVCVQEDIPRLSGFLGVYGVGQQTVVSVQPVSQSRKATLLCIEAALAYGWNLSTQVHKYLDLK